MNDSREIGFVSKITNKAKKFCKFQKLKKGMRSPVSIKIDEKWGE